MQLSVLRSAATALSAVVAGSVLVGVSPAKAQSTAQSASCVATELQLPAGSPTDVFVSLHASDSTARYQVGNVQDTTGARHPLFWTDGGEPQILEPLPGESTSLIDVNKHGTVLGQTSNSDGTEGQPWLYSQGTVRKLKAPAHTIGISARALNDRGDVVGHGRDTVAGKTVPIVWPTGGKPQVLPAAASADAVDINEAGVVVGNTTSGELRTGALWKRWDSNPELVSGEAGADVWLRQIRGDWFVGLQSYDDGALTGGRWNTASATVVTFPEILDAVNGSGDVAYVTDDGRSIVARPDGTQYEITAAGYNTVRTLFERGQAYDAAGDRDYGFARAVLWSGCAG